MADIRQAISKKLLLCNLDKEHYKSIMAKPPRILLPKTLVFITSRVQQGLPFVPHPEMNQRLWGIISRAQFLYDVQICALLFMGNHFHMLAVVTDRDAIPSFMRRVKTESALLINKYLGRRQHSVWCDGYDCVPILTPDDAIQKFVYLYTNPQRAKLCGSIEEYKGISTWEMFLSNNHIQNHTWRGRCSLVSNNKQINSQSHDFILSPYNWIDVVFNGAQSHEEIQRKIITLVRLFESRISKIKTIAQAKDIKKSILKNKHFMPRKYGRRMWCICSDQKIRIRFISYIKSLKNKAIKAYHQWKLGDLSFKYPLEFFSPRLPTIANPVFATKFVALP